MSDERRAPERRKVSSLAEIPPGIEPPRDLWPQIDAQIALERGSNAGAGLIRGRGAPRRVFITRSLAAAAMVASVAVGVWIGRSVLPGAPGAPAATDGVVSLSAPPLARPTAFQAAYVSDPRYQRDRAALLKDLGARLAALPPASREKVVRSLTAIQRAKQDLESALGKDPSNALLQELLVNTYQDEMRVLTDLHQASDAGAGI